MSERRQQRSRRMPSWLVGLGLVVVVAIASVLAFTKELPFGDPYEVRAVFGSAQSLRPGAPVRIAGVQVGEVAEIEHLTADSGELAANGRVPEELTRGEQGAVVTMELTPEALPLHEDATFKVRPRLFLEGNYFIDVEPGSPNAPEVSADHTFPVNQTSYSVQLDEVLTTLQSDVRADLRTFLDQFGNALVKHGGAEGFRELYGSSARSYKFTSQVSEALLGTEPGDLRGLIRNLDRVVRGLGRDEQALQGLVRNLRIVSGSFAAEDAALGRAIDELPATLAASRPAFARLNQALPAVRAFAREALPGVRSTPETLRAATPFVEQFRALVSRRELRGLTADLRPTVPRLAELSHSTIPFLGQARALSSCFNEVVIPWSQDTVVPTDDVYPHDPVGRVFEETAYGVSGIASESRSGDANGQYIRVQAGAGANTVKVPAFGGGGVGFSSQSTVGLTPFDLIGAMPRIQDSEKPRFRPDVPCETQEPPNLEAGNSPVPFDENTANARLPNANELLSDVAPRQLRRAARGLGFNRTAAKELSKLAGEER